MMMIGDGIALIGDAAVLFRRCVGRLVSLVLISLDELGKCNDMLRWGNKKMGWLFNFHRASVD